MHFFLAFELLPSIGLQSLSVVQSAETLGISKYVTGVAIFGIVFITIVGGIKRVGALMDKIVPFMSFAYFILAWIIILANYKNIHSFLDKCLQELSLHQQLLVEWLEEQ